MEVYLVTGGSCYVKKLINNKQLTSVRYYRSMLLAVLSLPAAECMLVICISVTKHCCKYYDCMTRLRGLKAVSSVACLINRAVSKDFLVVV